MKFDLIARIVSRNKQSSLFTVFWAFIFIKDVTYFSELSITVFLFISIELILCMRTKYWKKIFTIIIKEFRRLKKRQMAPVVRQALVTVQTE